jgi:hypothetical protein
VSEYAVPRGQDRLIPFLSAIIAVLAALGTTFSHHRSIQALAMRNNVLLLTAKASDQYSYYQTQRLKVTLYQVLIAENPQSQIARTGKLRDTLAREQLSSWQVYKRAKDLEKEAQEEQERALSFLDSYERIEMATMLFEISIAFASIAALTGARPMLWVGVALSAIGLAIGLLGYFQAH